MTKKLAKLKKGLNKYGGYLVMDDDPTHTSLKALFVGICDVGIETGEAPKVESDPASENEPTPVRFGEPTGRYIITARIFIPWEFIKEEGEVVNHLHRIVTTIDKCKKEMGKDLEMSWISWINNDPDWIKTYCPGYNRDVKTGLSVQVTYFEDPA